MKQDAIALLKQDHREVETLLEELSSSTERAFKRRTELLEKIALAIRAHTRIEEELFYPAFKDACSKKDDQKLYYEAVEEHRAATMVLEDCLKADPASLHFAGKAKVLKELILHHAEEEEKEMFPHAKKVMDKEELQELGAQLATRKEELMSAGLSAMTGKTGRAKGRATSNGASRRGSGRSSRLAHA